MREGKRICRLVSTSRNIFGNAWRGRLSHLFRSCSAPLRPVSIQIFPGFVSRFQQISSTDTLSSLRSFSEKWSKFASLRSCSNCSTSADFRIAALTAAASHLPESSPASSKMRSRSVFGRNFPRITSRVVRPIVLPSACGSSARQAFTAASAWADDRLLPLDPNPVGCIMRRWLRSKLCSTLPAQASK